MKLAQEILPVNRQKEKVDAVIIEIEKGPVTPQMEASRKRFWQLLLGRLLVEKIGDS